MATFRDDNEEARFIRQTQLTKYSHVYSVTLLIPYPAAGEVSKADAVLQIMEDANFHITEMYGCVSDPVDSDGQLFEHPSGSNMSLLFPMALATNRGERGVWFMFQNEKINHPLQLARPPRNSIIEAAQVTSPYNQNMIEFNSVFGPGYDFDWGKGIVFEYTLNKGERLKIQLENRQYSGVVTTGLYSRVSIAFKGHRYATK